MKVLIGYSRCPYTRSAFEKRGHMVTTCDLRPSDHSGHYQGDVWDILHDSWDIAILHPMCTYLTVSAAWAYGDGPYHQKVKPDTLVGAARRRAREDALDNFRRLLSLPYPVAVENPARSFVSKSIRSCDQAIHPYQFGDDVSKLTGLWLNGLPKLVIDPAKRVPGRMVGRVERWSNQTDSGQNNLPSSEDRWLIRSDTYPGIANAMAEAWG